MEEQVHAIQKYAHLEECNDLFAHVYGFDDAEQVRGVPVSSFFPVDNLRFLTYFQHFASSNYRLTDEEIITSDALGHRKHFQSNMYGILRGGHLVSAWGTWRDVTASRRAQVIQAAIYKITQTVVSSGNIQELFTLIHSILGDLMPVQNFFIALYDKEAQLLRFPYFVDEYDESPGTKKLGKGLTEYVLRTGKPLLASPEVFDALVARGEVESMGAPSIDWLGAPLACKDEIIGVMAVQTYTEGIRFTEEDKDILQFVSTQVAMVIERKQAEENLRVSEARYRGIVEDQTELIFRWLPDGTLTFVNGAYCRYHNKTREELIGTKFMPSLMEEDRARLQEIIKSMDRENPAFSFEIRRSMLGNEVRWEQWTNRALFDDQGHILEFQSVGRDVTERKQREGELEAITTVSTALRKASTRVEMLPVILDQLADLVRVEGAALAIIDPVSDELVFDLGRGTWSGLTGMRLPVDKGLAGQVLSSGQPYRYEDPANDANLSDFTPVHNLRYGACVPLIAQGQAIGTMWVGKNAAFTSRDTNLLRAVSDIAASAIHRTTLHEQTQLRLQRLTALRNIDTAISASMDVRVTLSILLDQITLQLGIHAADVLLLNSSTQTLEFAAGSGFSSPSFQIPYARKGGGYASQAALERRIIHVPNLGEVTERYFQAQFLANEKFVAYSAVPLIAKGQIKGVLELFSRIPLSLDPEWLDFLRSLGVSAAIAIDNAELLNKLQYSNVELSLAYDATIEGWARALELRDSETEGHTRRVTDLTMRLARRMGVNEEDLEHIRRGVILHDIGKMAIPDKILLKEGPLTEDEWEIMRLHPVYAYQLLSPIPYLRSALDIPYYHHERWDGSGYPHGLRGEEIPLSARIFAVADVWDALRSDRPYRLAWSEEKTRKYMREQAGVTLDPQATAALLEMVLD